MVDVVSNQLTASAGSSPKAMYSFFMLGLCKEFYSSLGVDNPDLIAQRAAGIIAFLPDPALRAKLWDEFETLSLTDKPTTAAVVVIGQVIDVMAEQLEWSTSANGSYL